MVGYVNNNALSSHPAPPNSCCEEFNGIQNVPEQKREDV